jgi:outer membrane receptor protein involved in Fe transport
MLDIRRAAVFRGPQGTLYGRNSMCGVLSLSTLSPSSYHGLRAGVEYGSADTFSARASYYGKTSRGLAIGGGVSFKHSDGFYTNAFNGDKCDPYDGLSLRFRIEKSLRPDLYFENIISAGTLTQGGWPYRQYISASEELLETSYNDMCSYRRFNLTEAMKLRLEGENYTLNSISSLQVLLDRMDLDQDFTTRSMFTMSQIQREGALTQEIVLKPKSGWKKDWWNWQSGAFAFWKFNRMSAPVNFKQDGIDDLILGNANNNIPEDVADGYDKPLLFKESGFPIGSEFGTHTYGAALYHESYFNVGKWLITAGLRLDFEGAVMDYCSDATVHYLFQPTMKDWKKYDILYKGQLSGVQYLEVLPKVSALYDFGEGANNVFATISKGYRSGGYNTQIFSDILQNKMMNGLMGDLGVYLDNAAPEMEAESTAYRPEKSWNLEIGGHLDKWIGSGHLSGSASVFYILCRDQQITIFPP